MGETNGISTPLYDNDIANQKQNRHAEDFMQYHNILSPEQLINLAEQGTPESREQLLEIAEKYDVPASEALSFREIVDRIILAMDNEDAPNMYIGTE
jgi:hypothetical protein